MWSNAESIPRGVTIYGTWLIQTPPDHAVIVVAASRVEKEPKDAFASVRSAGASIMAFLEAGRFGEFGTSRITLSEEVEWAESRKRRIGYAARLTYTIKLIDLDRTEELLSGVVAAGANEVDSVTFETSQIEQLRDEARRKAVEAARSKAQLFAREAGVSLGKVIAIQDENPPHIVLGEREFDRARAGGVSSKAFDPAVITVGASVFLTFEIAGG